MLNKKDFGIFLKNARTGNFKTRTDLACALKVSYGTYRCWELGMKAPDIIQAYAIAKYYEITMNEMFELSNIFGEKE